ncbi:hypothetical protein QQY66_25095 [Streptomyces sp. DG2A-72]|uniref:hypothetical protein n=1 Tax=Streptomyces sp. DG2A-72 TaxID=3051386 RepID=UPI00265C2BF5|nr:hypothetical protein [Streptomyces sp. DG2A-72]MDO0934797.1 hypothetical protein [Streptomyces sp. DG2A-72]
MSGTSHSSAWISSDPPDYGEDLAIPYGDGGSFEVELTVDGTGSTDGTGPGSASGGTSTTGGTGSTGGTASTTDGGSLASTGVTVLTVAALAAGLLGAGRMAYRRGRTVG